MSDHFPETIFITLDPPDEEGEPPYLDTYRTLPDAAKFNGPCTVGVYKLVETMDVVMEHRITRRVPHEPRKKKKK